MNVKRAEFGAFLHKRKFVAHIKGMEEKTMRIANMIAYILVIVGAVNWGLFGLFDFNLVSTIFGAARAAGSVIVYSLIALAALWLIVSPIMTNGVLWLNNRRAHE